jgi:acyl carrier protein phosphodiesterase
MNFLSHFYFDRDHKDPYYVLGILLPDLIKNADKKWNIHPEKNYQSFKITQHLGLYYGYQKHLAVDGIFHNSEFFKHYQNQFKADLKQAIGTSKVKPFFLSHITLELLLDHILISQNMVDVGLLYKHLNSIDEQILEDFLLLNHINDTAKFQQFFYRFKTEQYLYSYLELDKISYALKRICMRVWQKPFTLDQEFALTNSLMNCKNELSKEFISIFEHIESELN